MCPGGGDTLAIFVPSKPFSLQSSLYIYVVYSFHFYRNELIPFRFSQAMTTEIDLIFFFLSSFLLFSIGHESQYIWRYRPHPLPMAIEAVSSPSLNQPCYTNTSDRPPRRGSPRCDQVGVLVRARCCPLSSVPVRVSCALPGRFILGVMGRSS